MKKIPLAKVPIVSNGEIARTGFILDYHTELTAMISRFPDGITAADMRTLAKIQTALRDAAGTDHVIIEDADHEILVQRLNLYRFAFYADEIIAFTDAILNAETISASHLIKSANK